MNKFSLTLTSVAALFTLSACNEAPVSYDCSNTDMIYSKHIAKAKQAYCAQQKFMSKHHTHADGITHLHENDAMPHYHTQKESLLESNEGVFLESDNDYDRESTLNDLSEDDAEVIEWRKQQRLLKQQNAQPAPTE